MVTANRWTGRGVREFQAERAIQSMVPGTEMGTIGSASPVAVRTPVQEEAPEDGIQVWEQPDEPLEAEIHDFWWDTDG